MLPVGVLEELSLLKITNKALLNNARCLMHILTQLSPVAMITLSLVRAISGWSVVSFCHNYTPLFSAVVLSPTNIDDFRR